MGEDFREWLAARGREAALMEARAAELLAGGDMDEYRALMRRKAEFLAGLADKSAPLLAGLPDSRRAEIGRTLRGFAASARTALDLDSVFYMSALLYPEDHTPGQPNDLERLIRSLRDRENAGSDS
jgi:hypothetical protein